MEAENSIVEVDMRKVVKENGSLVQEVTSEVERGSEVKEAASDVARSVQETDPEERQHLE